MNCKAQEVPLDHELATANGPRNSRPNHNIAQDFRCEFQADLLEKRLPQQKLATATFNQLERQLATYIQYRISKPA